MNIHLLGIDIAKNVFQLHGIDKAGKAVLKKRIKREDLMAFIANLPPCIIAMEACSGAHYWARQFQQHGHTPRLIHPPFVKAFLKGGKNDAKDAEAITEAASRPSMRFVPLKSIPQQDLQNIHRTRSLLVKEQVALSNQIRGLLREYGLIVPKGIYQLRAHLPFMLADTKNELTSLMREMLQRMLTMLNSKQEEVDYYTKKLQEISRQDEQCQKLSSIPGLGPITTTALISSIGDVNHFKNGRQFAAYLGLTPKQKSSGDKIILGGITKRGDKYLRNILVQGAKSALLWSQAKKNKKNGFSEWAAKLIAKKHPNVAAVALANKNARIAWRLMKDNTPFDPERGYA